ncbi:hypothetical protein NE237_017225 [Protea cynaroides]|uniref:BED-type domain-containing protein n=1 Tax=Protea cynaroides TaxID=273540 RepID=A0A9Q0K7N2_9MAGN|nr:hypothetical protein NE237_017225 [Protea cynaroides]
MSTPLNELTPRDIMEGVGTPNVDDLFDDGPLLMPRDSVESVSSLPKIDGKRRRRSTVWDSFKVIPGDKYDDGKERAECLKCKIVYRANTNINGASMLRRHLKNCFKQDNKDIKQMMLGKNQGKLDLMERKIDLNLVRDLITRLIVKQELPLVFVEREEFRNLISYICPEYCHISRNSQMAQISKLYQFEVESVNDAVDIALALGNVLSINDTRSDVASTVASSSSGEVCGATFKVDAETNSWDLECC